MGVTGGFWSGMGRTLREVCFGAGHRGNSRVPMGWRDVAFGPTERAVQDAPRWVYGAQKPKILSAVDTTRRWR